MSLPLLRFAAAGGRKPALLVAQGRCADRRSTFPRLDQAFYAPPPGGGLPGDQGSVQPEVNVDWGTFGREVCLSADNVIRELTALFCDS